MEIKKLFTLRRSEDPETFVPSTDEQDEQRIRITYYQSGYGAALKAMGGPINFRACLENVYGSFEQQCREQEIQQAKLKQPYIEERTRKQSELKNTEAAISIFEERKQQTVEKINGLKNDIEEVKHYPEKHGVESAKRPKAQFYIGLFLLVPIT